MSDNIHVPEALQTYFRDHPRPALAFSGGVDSTYLLYAAKACDADVDAYFVKSQFQSMRELDDAKRIAEELGVDLHVLLVNTLSDPGIRANPGNRCYLCKRRIFERVTEQARTDRKKYVMDGTNASDDPVDRPGMKALEELGVASPLRLCGITKSRIRDLSREAGLWTWNKPTDSCLATRIPQGTEITEEDLLRVEDAENELRALGLTDFRVRQTDSGARLETVGDQEDLIKSIREIISETLLKYYPAVEYGIRTPRP